jgi:hypothetical protein
VAERQRAHDDDLERSDVADAPASDAAELREILRAERLEAARPRRRAAVGRGVTIGGHLKAPPLLLKARAIDACRRGSGSPLSSGLIDALALSLLGGVADRAEWSADVRRALWVCEDAADGARLRARRVPWALEQLRAAARIRRERLVHLSVLRRRGASLPPLDDYEKETEALAAAEVYYVARQQCTIAMAEAEKQAHVFAEQGIPPRRGRRPKQPEPRTILDGRWHGGHPDQHSIPWLLLRVEIWRDIRAEARPTEGRVSRSDALAEVLLEELKAGDRRCYRLIDNLRRELEEDGSRSAPALARAMTALHARTFRGLQVRLSQALKPCPPDPTSHRRDVVRGSRRHV